MEKSVRDACFLISDEQILYFSLLHIQKSKVFWIGILAVITAAAIALPLLWVANQDPTIEIGIVLFTMNQRWAEQRFSMPHRIRPAPPP